MLLAFSQVQLTLQIGNNWPIEDTARILFEKIKTKLRNNGLDDSRKAAG
jgi:hypothetical protein